MKILAAFRLMATEGSTEAPKAEDQAKEQLNKKIEEKREQVKQLKKSMPSRQNRTAQSPHQKWTTQKRIADEKGRIADLELQKQGK